MNLLKKLKSKVFNHYTKKYNLIQKPRFEEMPVPEINMVHVQNIKVVPTREELLALLPKNGVVAELGVDKGGFSEKILTINSPQKLCLIDVWQSKRYPEKLYQEVSSKFGEELKNGKVEIHRGYSTEVVNDFPDKYFDWIYIDTVHDYKVTKAELELYKSKMKEGGIIAGHDFIVGEIDVPWKYGVIEAVYEFCKEHHWEIIFLTMERGISPSFAIKEIANQ
ncbi:class I SAM-dependent methyltransferase [Aquiflexum gelatinilyticum]|uniref:class I SAM-dependent methyltransferase n=1 Tax=Aquiflexum gelatinilyticum TaxID=2961943 RepID=UPI0021690A16|nr:class I SAM-dependent methyltransferase [Aquiflexum gelatinilyticum]MCS4434564.1 class I SAM-dependent methyltransferase [Aquiflexum gelatinilyticum]